jgi:TATA-box binding protein (TBP) (component of TFIID and TFIIIB)
VDNITASGRFTHTVHLPSLKNIPNIQVRYKPDRFAGASVKYTAGCGSDCGTIVLFHSGSYIVVGAKSATQVDVLFQRVLADLLSHRLLPPHHRMPLLLLQEH